MHNSYKLVLLRDKLVGKCQFLYNCRLFHCLVARDTKKKHFFELSYSLHFKTKC